MKRARDNFVIDKPRGKLICKVVIGGSETNGDIKYCNKELSYNNNTSSMNNHLNSFHKNIKFTSKNDIKLYEDTKETPTSIKNSLLNKNAYDFDSDRFISITDHVVEFLAETNQPLSLVDNQAFIKLLSKLDNKYKLPGRQTITNKTLKDKAEIIKSKIKIELDEAEFISVTLDGWSSVASDAYLGNKYYYFKFQK